MTAPGGHQRAIPWTRLWPCRRPKKQWHRLSGQVYWAWCRSVHPRKGRTVLLKSIVGMWPSGCPLSLSGTTLHHSAIAGNFP